MSSTAKHLIFFLCFLLISPNLFGQSVRPGVGSIPYADINGTGVTFRVWAPNATNVTVAGSFNSWNATSHALTADPGFGAGYWSADVTEAITGDQYKYVIDTSLWRKDPRSLKVVNSSDNSIVFDPTLHQWDVPTFTKPIRKDLVLYEMHIRTYSPLNTFSPQGTFETALNKLNHLHNLGVNAIQLMPIAEFPGDQSWGYNPSDPYAVESAYGGPENFQAFVDACHARGIAIFLDVVHNHWGPSDLATWQFDGWAPDPSYGGIYHYNVAGKCCTPWGDSRPDYSRTEVRDYIKENYFSWVDDFHVDGFRTDSPYHTAYYGDPVTLIPEAVTLMQEINTDLQNNYTNVLSIQENGETTWGFDTKWDMSFLEVIRDIVSEPNDANRDLALLASHINNGAGLGRINYIDSHDTAGDLNGNTRITRLIDPGDPSSFWARKRSLLGAVLTMTSPGTPMVLQGEEMAEHWAFSDSTGFRWEEIDNPVHAGHVNAYRDLIHARRNLRGGMAGLEGTGCHVHYTNHTDKIIAFKRWDAGGGADDVVVVMNFSVNDFTNNTTLIEFPSSGTWHVHFNSDRGDYGADYSNIGPTSVTTSGNPPTAPVNIAKYSALIFSKTAPSITAGTSWVSDEFGVGCAGTQTIYYNTANGPLSGATNVTIQIGHDGWQGTFTATMTPDPIDSNQWTYAYNDFPGGTRGINYVFTDGAGTWDNNYSKDWYALINCASTAHFIPAIPVGCSNIVIQYENGSGALEHASHITAHIGQNNWSVISDISMTEVSNGLWECSYLVTDPAFTLQVAFNDGGSIWDTNGGNNWNTTVDHCHTNAGNVVLFPAQPDGCDPFTISYDPETGPLSGAAAITLAIGNDGWQNVQNISMTQNVAGVWWATFTPFPGLDWVNFAFNNNGPTWDNNYGNDWNYSVFCPPVDGLVSTVPVSPVGCVPLTIIYEEQPQCPLENAANIYIKIERGAPFNDQLHEGLAMTEISPGVWEAEFHPPPGTLA